MMFYIVHYHIPRYEEGEYVCALAAKVFTDPEKADVFAEKWRALAKPCSHESRGVEKIEKSATDPYDPKDGIDLLRGRERHIDEE